MEFSGTIPTCPGHFSSTVNIIHSSLQSLLSLFSVYFHHCCSLSPFSHTHLSLFWLTCLASFLLPFTLIFHHTSQNGPGPLPTLRDEILKHCTWSQLHEEPRAWAGPSVAGFSLCELVFLFELPLLLGPSSSLAPPISLSLLMRTEFPSWLWASACMGKGRAQEKPSSAPFHHVNTASSHPRSTGLSQSSACSAGGLRISNSCPAWTRQLGCSTNTSLPSPPAPREQPEPSPQPRTCLLDSRHRCISHSQRSRVTAHAGNR